MPKQSSLRQKIPSIGESARQISGSKFGIFMRSVISLFFFTSGIAGKILGKTAAAATKVVAATMAHWVRDYKTGKTSLFDEEGNFIANLTRFFDDAGNNALNAGLFGVKTFLDFVKEKAGEITHESGFGDTRNDKMSKEDIAALDSFDRFLDVLEEEREQKIAAGIKKEAAQAEMEKRITDFFLQSAEEWMKKFSTLLASDELQNNHPGKPIDLEEETGLGEHLELFSTSLPLIVVAQNILPKGLVDHILENSGLYKKYTKDEKLLHENLKKSEVIKGVAKIETELSEAITAVQEAQKPPASSIKPPVTVRQYSRGIKNDSNGKGI